MSQRTKAYPQKFRRKSIELHEAGRSVVELVEEFEPYSLEKKTLTPLP